jgi:hypothetical protein
LDTADDFLIAQMLQKQFDKEHDSALHCVSTVVFVVILKVTAILLHFSMYFEQNCDLDPA